MPHEINLLPFSRRRILHRLFVEESIGILLRRVLLMLMSITALGVAAVVVISFSERLGSFEVSSALEERIKQYQELRSEVALRNQALQEMKIAIGEKIEWSALFQEVFEALPPGVTLREMSGDIASRHLLLSGTAPARSSLIVLEGRLHALPWVETIESPPSNLLQRLNTPFSFTVTLKETLP